MSRVRPIRETDEMKSSRFSEEQIIGILKEQESGMSTAEVCRRHGISSATFYKWKAKFGGLEVSDARRLKQLEDENARLKRLLADAVLDNAMLKEIASKKF
jgi:putative transposase